MPDIYDYDAPELHAIWAAQVILPDRAAGLLVWDDEQQEA